MTIPVSCQIFLVLEVKTVQQERTVLPPDVSSDAKKEKKLSSKAKQKEHCNEQIIIQTNPEKYV